MCRSTLVVSAFLAKTQKYFKVGVVRKYDEVTVCLETRTLHLLKSYLQQNGRAEKMPVVGRNLIQLFYLESCFWIDFCFYGDQFLGYVFQRSSSLSNLMIL